MTPLLRWADHFGSLMKLPSCYTSTKSSPEKVLGLSAQLFSCADAAPFLGDPRRVRVEAAAWRQRPSHLTGRGKKLRQYPSRILHPAENCTKLNTASKQNTYCTQQRLQLHPAENPERRPGQPEGLRKRPGLMTMRWRVTQERIWSVAFVFWCDSNRVSPRGPIGVIPVGPHVAPVEFHPSAHSQSSHSTSQHV